MENKEKFAENGVVELDDSDLEQVNGGFEPNVIFKKVPFFKFLFDKFAKKEEGDEDDPFKKDFR